MVVDMERTQAEAEREVLNNGRRRLDLIERDAMGQTMSRVRRILERQTSFGITNIVVFAVVALLAQSLGSSLKYDLRMQKREVRECQKELIERVDMLIQNHVATATQYQRRIADLEEELGSYRSIASIK